MERRILHEIRRLDGLRRSPPRVSGGGPGGETNTVCFIRRKYFLKSNSSFSDSIGRTDRNLWIGFETFKGPDGNADNC